MHLVGKRDIGGRPDFDDQLGMGRARRVVGWMCAVGRRQGVGFLGRVVLGEHGQVAIAPAGPRTQSISAQLASVVAPIHQRGRGFVAM